MHPVAIAAARRLSQPVPAAAAVAATESSSKGDTLGKLLPKPCVGPPLFAMEDIEGLSDTQRVVAEHILTGVNVFATGPAGCGKSTIISALQSALTAAGTAFATLSSTAISAQPLFGETIHRFAGLSVSSDGSVVSCASSMHPLTIQKLREPKLIIIDEVSMVGEEVMSALLRALRRARGNRLPQFVLFGDFLQLPPVKSKLLLGTPTWESLNLRVVYLDRGDRWRQTDVEFIRALDDIRMGTVSPETDAYMRSRVGVPLEDSCATAPLTHLRSHVADVDAVNEKHLDTLEGPVTEFYGLLHLVKKKSKGGGKKRGREDCEDEGHYGDGSEGTTDLVGTRPPWAAHLRARVPVSVAVNPETFWKAGENLVKSSPMQPRLRLKVGCQVMCTANIDRPDWVNGSQGIVKGFSRGLPVIDVAEKPGGGGGGGGGHRTVKRHSVQSSFVIPGWDIVYEQIPLKLCTSITIHKTQGMGLQRAIIDLSGVFDEGQAYVALSRMRDPSGFSLQRWDPRVVKANPFVKEWYAKLAREMK